MPWKKGFFFLKGTPSKCTRKASVRERLHFYFRVKTNLKAFRIEQGRKKMLVKPQKI